MGQYIRKITLDFSNYKFTFSDASVTNYDSTVLRQKIRDGVAFTGIVGPDINLLIFFKQKIKDLGIYDDILK